MSRINKPLRYWWGNGTSEPQEYNGEPIRRIEKVSPYHKTAVACPQCSSIISWGLDTCQTCGREGGLGVMVFDNTEWSNNV